MREKGVRYLAVQDIQDRFLNAMDIIIDSALSKLQFDKTIQAIIVDDSRRDEGIFIVESQSQRFEAYSRTNEFYRKDDEVWIQIPQNDYKNQKIIVGRTVDETSDTPFLTYKKPFDDFVQLVHLESELAQGPWYYYANDPTQGVLGEEVNLMWQKSWSVTDPYQNVNTHLGITIDVQSLLHTYRVESGDYGFYITMTGDYKDEKGVVTNNDTRGYYFSNYDMYGNPYSYVLPTNQQVVIDIRAFQTITDIKLYFFQLHNFVNILGENIPYREADDADRGMVTPTNLNFSDLNIYLGMKTEELKSDKAFLYTYDSLRYGENTGAQTQSEREALDTRTLYFSWVNITDEKPVLINTLFELKDKGAKAIIFKKDSNWYPEAEGYDGTKQSHYIGGLYWKPVYEVEIKEDEADALLQYAPWLDIEKSQQQFKAMFLYNNSIVVSDILTFTNVVDVETVNADLARNDSLIIKCCTRSEDGELIPNDGLGNFFVYDENGNVLANDDNVLYSRIKYYLELYIKVGYDTNGIPIYSKLTHDEEDDEDGENNRIPFTVEWDYPVKQTMIRSFESLVSKDEVNYGMTPDDDLWARQQEAIKAFYIKSTYDMRYTNNTIRAHVTRNGQEYTAQFDMNFGQADYFGCEYIPVIRIIEPVDGRYINSRGNYSLECRIYDRTGKELSGGDTSERKITWNFIGGQNKPIINDFGYGLSTNVDYISNNVYSSGPRNTIEPFIVEVTVEGVADYPLTMRKGIMVCNDVSFMNNHDVTCPDRIEFRSDGQSPIFDNKPFEIRETNEGTLTTESASDRIMFPDWTIVPGTDAILKLKKTTVKASSAPIVSFDEDTEVETTAIVVGPDGQPIAQETYNKYELQFSAKTLADNTALDNATMSQQWTDDLLKEFIYVKCQIGNVAIAQAIAFDRNYYASSLINNWNGQSLELDEENSAVIGKMIAAGTKDASNRFTGIMMGSWAKKADSSLDVPGIYGFRKGSQTFGFKEDGTGFIGPSGYGRIHFDGRNALISNSAKTCYINLNPIPVGNLLKDAETNPTVWDTIQAKGYSQYFLYCETKKTEYDLDVDSENSALVNSVKDPQQYVWNTWAKDFIQSEDKEYFVVDPSYGVVISGGIFAKYGMIGKNYPWIINDDGLTQKNIFGKIFLGNPEKNLHTGVGDLEERKYVFSFTSSEDYNRLQTGITDNGFFYTKIALIGGWNITADQLSSGTGNKYVALNSQTGDYVFWAGKEQAETVNGESISRAPFCIKRDGTLYATNAHIGGSFDGDLTGDHADGTVGGWNIETGYLWSVSKDNNGTPIANSYVVLSSDPSQQLAMWSGGTTVNANGSLSPNEPGFAVSKTGILYAVGAQIGGTFKGNGEFNGTGTFNENSTFAGTSSGSHTGSHSSGTVGLWNIENGILYSGSGDNYVALASTGHETYAIWAGDSDPEKAEFSVTKLGKLKATGAEISGKITANDGEIGGWTISDGLLHSGTNDNYVGISAVGTYAFWAGDETEKEAPFSVTANGEVRLTKLVALGEPKEDGTRSETVVDLRNYSFWKLSYHTIKSWSISGNQVSIVTTGGTINFNRASTIQLTHTISGNQLTVEAYTMAGGGAQGEQLTITSGKNIFFDSEATFVSYADKKITFDVTNDVTGNIRATVDASEAYDAATASSVSVNYGGGDTITVTVTAKDGTTQTFYPTFSYDAPYEYVGSAVVDSNYYGYAGLYTISNNGSASLATGNYQTWRYGGTTEDNLYRYIGSDSDA